MSAVSRLRKLLQTLTLAGGDHDTVDPMEESLAFDEEEGLLLPTVSGPRSSVEGAVVVPEQVDASDDPAPLAAPEQDTQDVTVDATGEAEPALENGVLPDDPAAETEAPEPAEAGERPALTLVKASADPQDAESSQESPSPAAVDDLLSAFRNTVMESSHGDLTKELDDAPVAELLSELREIRGMLPATLSEQNAEEP